MKEESESIGKLDSRLGDSVVGSILFSKFEVLDVIADGGKGRVLKVRNIDLQSLFALKVLTNSTISDEDMMRFHNEAKIASKLSHPNIASVFDFGSFKGFPYLVMELVDGMSLSEYLKERRVLNLQDFLDVFLQVTKALVHAHRLGVIHRDVKPDNIAVKKDDTGLTAKLLDFGLAKKIELDTEKIGRLTARGAVLGTPLYMSPEQTRALP
ncbi:MAG: serine/threonine protein kinase, partial [Candidatus Obscuribacterales bacterium]|nr:serine/threonine protein kinase [Candidatus Obscuribacterales bacterium]